MVFFSSLLDSRAVLPSPSRATSSSRGDHMKTLFTALFLAIFFSLPTLASPSRAQNVEEILDKINRLPASERQQRLVEGARKEAELVWYSTMNRENSQELVTLFEKDHPYVRVKLLNGSAVQTMTR